VSSTAEEFARMLTGYMTRPVLDATGLTGRYDFPFPQGAAINEDGQAAIFTSVQQYGLQMESAKAPLEYLVVERVEQVSEN
jgi:uncharacterized protein (TIGR03435 family)